MFNPFLSEWHGLYHHPTLAAWEIGVLALPFGRTLGIFVFLSGPLLPQSLQGQRFAYDRTCHCPFLGIIQQLKLVNLPANSKKILIAL